MAVELGIYFVEADPASVPPSTVTFDVAMETSPESPGHALSVLRTELPPDGLPENDVGQAETFDERIEIVYSEGVTGEAHTVGVELQAGPYVLICNIADHYGRGMHTGFTVA